MPTFLLHRIEPVVNMARFYQIETSADLFGSILLERRWGRIGTRGQARSSSHPSIDLAEAAAFKLLKSKTRRGYRLLEMAE